ncbi:hypothetical protein [Aureibacter tunicatorum]|uniref:Uncharacterized protein n=1 Tax=Aureibacter tunicatorum TaxID=866807 RepID=A0AAE3XQ96_9BACT|nr:hypothetical protein [Aureibacter tunicatorum]MDR6240059.1 hypothetical protein [Aureibacter tunicatorum]BDD04531.1 hypothetical protein AUTU_20140 [Aureibacter tunicatorum]
MIKTLTFLSILLLISINAISQQNFKEGFIIYNSGDTTKTKIDYRSDANMSIKCTAIIDNKKITYSPNHIKYFEFNDSKKYISKKITSGKKVFLEYLVEGEINLYYYLNEKAQKVFFVEKINEKIIELTYSEGVKRIDGKSFNYQTEIHQHILLELMKDRPQFKSRIKSLKKPEEKKLKKLIHQYNLSKNNNNDEVILNSKKQRKYELSLVGGTTNFSDKIPEVKPGAYSSFGIIADFNLPKTHENLYITFGFIHNRLIIEDERESYNEYPLYLTYKFPESYLIRPQFSIGLLRPNYSIGLSIKASKKINLGINTIFKFGTDRINIVPHQHTATNVYGTICYKF